MPNESASPQQRVATLGLLLAIAWCTMVLTHEMGHILSGWAAGGTLRAVELAPWKLPYSLFQPDPHPLLTLWGGPLLGVAVPLLAALLIRQTWSWFIAYFCVLANGTYLACGWMAGDRYLDTARMLEHGTHPGWIAIYCVATIGFGYVGFRRQCQKILR
jgi:hypothetical protein